MTSTLPVIFSSGDLLADRRYAWALGLMEEGDFTAAADLLAEVTALAPQWPAGWLALGRAREAEGDRPAAVAAFRHCAARDPDDLLAARLHLARLEPAESPPEMSAGYVRGLFDQYAQGFEAHLTQALAYRGPDILFGSLAAACLRLGRKPAFGRVLDLGCGTGLMAEPLAAVSDEIIGVDLSERMVDLARRSGRYRQVAAGDIVAFLAAEPAFSCDLAVAADVLVYIGDLEPLMTAVARVLQQGGLFAFTVQRREAPGYGLGADMRYHHSEDYVADQAAAGGLKPVLCENVSTRLDQGLPVPGLVVVLSR